VVSSSERWAGSVEGVDDLKKILGTLLFVSAIVVSLWQPTPVVGISIRSVASLPTGACPLGVVFDETRNCLWTSGLGQALGLSIGSSLYRIDLPIGTVRRYYPSGVPDDTLEHIQLNTEVGLKGVTLDGRGKVWIASSYTAGEPHIPWVRACIWRFNPETETFDFGDRCGSIWGKQWLAYSAGKIYVNSAGAELIEIDQDTLGYAVYSTAYGQGFANVIQVDRAGNIWRSFTTDVGFVDKFDIVTKLFPVKAEGLVRPLGITFMDNGTMYVAENSEVTRSIVRLNNGLLEKRFSFGGKKPFDVRAVGSSIVWSSEDRTMNLLSALAVNTAYPFSSQPFYLSDNVLSVFFGYYGSPHGAGALDLAEASTTTATVTATTTETRTVTQTVYLTTTATTTVTSGSGGSKGSTRITLSASPTPGYINQPVTFSGTLYGSWGPIKEGLVAGKPVRIMADWGFSAVVTTGSDGKFSTTTSCSSKGGTYPVNATFVQDSELTGSFTSMSYQVLEYIETTLSLSDRYESSGMGGARRFYGYLKEKNTGKPVANMKIRLTIYSGGYGYIFDVTTNSQGYYDYLFTTNGGIFTWVEARFSGSGLFLASFSGRIT
jgi:hypothetical protein